MLTFTRKPWSPFAPDITYTVEEDGLWVGEVARFEGQRRWHASNITWNGGRELDETFATRQGAAQALVKDRLEYLRGEIEAERISWGEISELQGLAEHIDPGDVQLLEWAGVPEFKEE